MCSRTESEGHLDASDQQQGSHFEQSSLFLPHKLSAYLTSSRISTAYPRNTTIAGTKLDTISKPVIANVSLTVFVSLLQVSDGTIHDQDVHDIIGGPNFDAKLFLPGLLHPGMP